MKKIRSLILTAVGLAALAFLLPVVVHAQAAVAAPVAQVAAAATPWYQSILTGENVAWVFGLVSGLVAVFKNQALSTSQKSLRAVIVGVEQATKLPAVQAEAQKIKATIQAYAVSHGVHDELHTLVQDITGQLLPADVAPVAPAPTATPTAPSSV